MKLALAAAVAAVAAASLPASAAVVIEGKEGEEPQRIVLDGNRMRMEAKEGDRRNVMIYDGDAKRFVQLDLEKKTYTEFTQSDLKAMRAMVDEQLAALPPEQREMAAKAMGKDRPEQRRWVKAGRSDRAAGAACDVYRLGGEGEQGEEEMCVAPFGSFGVQKSDLVALRAFEEAIQQLSPGQGGAGVHWSDLPGVPVIAWESEDGKKKETFRATKVEKARAAASDFAVPAGFAKDPGFAEQMKELQQGKGK